MSSRPWWQSGIIYQVYPRSFQDTTGNGVGDLPGILARLPYLAQLGIDALWLSPIYPSPMADFGYDVANYIAIDPLFGTLADFDRLLAATHTAGLRLILDFVPNHTSDQHPWFLESRSSRTSPKRDWYLWHDPGPNNTPPNNWQSNFGGPGWTLDPTTGQMYFHSFLPQQPDLNWRNPEVVTAVFNALRFWLDRGVDGFRMDVLWLLIKDDQLRNNPPNPDWHPGDPDINRFLQTWTANRPETHTLVRQMRALLDQYPDRLLIGEIYLPLDQLVTFYEPDPATGQLLGAQLPFNFQLILTPWQPDTIAALIRHYESLLPPGAWPNWVLGNHDQSRLATRLGPDQLRIAALLLLTLRGTPTMYYGDELGLPDTPIAPDQIRDPAALRQPGITGQGRDPERTPMLWDTTPTAAFTTGTPWLPIAPGTPATLSVAAEGSDPRSPLSLYRALIHLRRSLPALHAGPISDIRDDNGVLRYLRQDPDTNTPTHLILANFTPDPRTVTVPHARVLLTTLLDGSGAEAEGPFHLEPHEGVLLQLL